MDDLKKFRDDRLRELITEDGTKLREMAKKLGTSIGVLSDWQNGNKIPRGDSIVKLATYFGVTSDYLLGLSDARSVNASIAAAVKETGLSEKAISVLSQMKKEDVEKLSKLIEFYGTI